MGAMEGMLVVSVEQAVAAPLCTARLADAGARVIKIERPGGDFARLYDTAANGESAYFTWLNHSKESLELDFKNAGDADLLHRIIARADVFVQNLAPGAMTRAGFGSKALRKAHANLITCDISGYGDAPEVAHMKAYDLLVQAESGLVDISGGPGEPGRIGISLCDIGAGVTAHAAIVEALLLRERSGQGSSLAISLFDVAAEWMSVPYIHAAYGDGAPKRVGLHHPSIAPYGAYQTSDGIKTILSIQNEREWLRLCQQVLLLKNLATDHRFSSNPARVANRGALDHKIDDVLAQIDATEFRRRLREADIAHAGLNTVDDLTRHPALSRRNITNSSGFPVKIPAHPVNWAGLRAVSDTAVPATGEHSDAIRREFAE